MEIDTSLGLHEIPKAAMALSRINDAVDQFLPNLGQFIKNTEEKVQPRKNYVIIRQDIGAISPGTGYEIRIERALWSKYHHQLEPKVLQFLPACPRIVGYSVALFGKKEQAKWGEIDLVGMSPRGLPIPIELKQDTGDNILKMIVQVAAYGIAVRYLWKRENSGFRKSWDTLGLRSDSDMPTSDRNSMDDISCICLATKAYWDRAFGTKAQKRTAGQIMDKSWQPINDLVDAFRKQKIYISFATVLVEPELPTISACDSITLPT